MLKNLPIKIKKEIIKVKVKRVEKKIPEHIIKLYTQFVNFELKDKQK